MTQGNRQRLGRSEARDMILEAAARVFNQKGRAVTVEDIAQEAGYSTSALYKHFSNKEDILRTLWTRVGERMCDVFLNEPPVELNFIKRLKWTLYRMAQMAEETREFYLAGMANHPQDLPLGQLGEDARTEIFRTIRDAMIVLMERGIAEGVLAPRDPEIYASAMGGYLHSLTIRWAIEGPYPLRPQIEQAIEIFLYGAGCQNKHETSPQDSAQP